MFESSNAINTGNNWLDDCFYHLLIAFTSSLPTAMTASYYRLSTLLTQQSTYQTNAHQIKPTKPNLAKLNFVDWVETLKKAKELNLWVRCAFLNVEYCCFRVYYKEQHQYKYKYWY